VVGQGFQVTERLGALVVEQVLGEQAAQETRHQHHQVKVIVVAHRVQALISRAVAAEALVQMVPMVQVRQGVMEA